VFSIKKKKSLFEEDQKNDTKERLFFHDVINHTHGLLLFLNHKESLNEGMSAVEVEILKKEIKALQSILRDQYSFDHKNLTHTQEWVTFEQAFRSLKTMMNTYLTYPEVKIEMILKGDIAFENSAEVQDRSLIYYPAFYRIMNNLIKNMSEAEASAINFSFNLSERGLFIETQNAMKATLQKDLPEYLSQLILNENTQALKGQGLDSIDHTASSCGGSFSFEIHNQVWINKIFLPVKNNLSGAYSTKKSA
jgi:hypothetical protein